MEEPDRIDTYGPPERVVAGLLRRQGKVLLCHRRPERQNYPNVWDLPGGHVDTGEPIAKTLARELTEELGVSIQPPEGAPWATLTAEGLELFIFIVDRWKGEPQNLAPEEHDDIRWVGVDELAKLYLADPSYEQLLRRAIS